MKCAVCGAPAVHRHHVVKRQRIRKIWRSLMAAKRRGGPKPWSVTKALADPRNLIPLCVAHHKEEMALPLPAGFWNFVNEYGLQGVVPRHLSSYTAERSLGAA